MRLKHETVLLAQDYLTTHQHEAEKYNRGRLDPVTGTYRKRALFSLPVLASSIDEMTIANQDCGDCGGVVEKHVKNILVVDPNPSILKLFRKSLKSMFPQAEIHTSRSAEEALRLVSAQLQTEYGITSFQHRNFDIIIIEQSLSQVLYGPSSHKDQRNNILTTNSACCSVSSVEKANYSQRWLQKPNSFSGSRGCNSLVPIDVCGSELIKAIKALETEVFGSSKSQSATYCQEPHTASSNKRAISISTKLFQWRSLMIGVSMQPDRDAAKLTEAGADVIWGKPLPHIGYVLRNQLVHLLISKRRRCTVE